jgi:hypothetical protein
VPTGLEAGVHVGGPADVVVVDVVGQLNDVTVNVTVVEVVEVETVEVGQREEAGQLHEEAVEPDDELRVVAEVEQLKEVTVGVTVDVTVTEAPEDDIDEVGQWHEDVVALVEQLNEVTVDVTVVDLVEVGTLGETEQLDGVKVEVIADVVEQLADWVIVTVLAERVTVVTLADCVTVTVVVEIEALLQVLATEVLVEDDKEVLRLDVEVGVVLANKELEVADIDIALDVLVVPLTVEGLELTVSGVMLVDVEMLDEDVPAVDREVRAEEVVGPPDDVEDPLVTGVPLEDVVEWVAEDEELLDDVKP